MTLTKNKMIREIGRRTRLKNREVQVMLEALIEVWAEELVSGGRIELEHFLVLEVIEIDRGSNSGVLKRNGISYYAPRLIHRLVAKPSKLLRKRLKKLTTSSKRGSNLPDA